jgi:hypothetical protein
VDTVSDSDIKDEEVAVEGDEVSASEEEEDFDYDSDGSQLDYDNE